MGTAMSLVGSFFSGIGSHIAKAAPTWLISKWRRSRSPRDFHEAVNEAAGLLGAVSEMVRDAYRSYWARGALTREDAIRYLEAITITIFQRRRAFGIIDAERNGLNVVIYANDPSSPKQPCLQVVARHAVTRFFNAETKAWEGFNLHNREWGAGSGSWVEGIWGLDGPVWTGKTAAHAQPGGTDPGRPEDRKQYNSFLGTPIGSRGVGRQPFGVFLVTTAAAGHWKEDHALTRHLAWLLQEQLATLFLLYERCGVLPLPALAPGEVTRHRLT